MNENNVQNAQNVQKDSDEKFLPHSIEAERVVLGGIMYDPEAWGEVSDIITGDDFYSPAHAFIFRTMQKIGDKDTVGINVATVINYLKPLGKLPYAGGLNYLYDLLEDIKTTANIKAYAEIVRERATLRRLISNARHLTEGAESKASEGAGWAQAAPHHDPEVEKEIRAAVNRVKEALGK